MIHDPDGAGHGGSLIEGVVVGLALEVGGVATLALAASQIRPLAWSPPIAPIGLVLVAASAFALVVGVYLEPAFHPFASLGGRIARRRVATRLDRKPV